MGFLKQKRAPAEEGPPKEDRRLETNRRERGIGWKEGETEREREDWTRDLIVISSVPSRVFSDNLRGFTEFNDLFMQILRAFVGTRNWIWWRYPSFMEIYPPIHPPTHPPTPLVRVWSTLHRLFSLFGQDFVLFAPGLFVVFLDEIGLGVWPRLNHFEPDLDGFLLCWIELNPIFTGFYLVLPGLTGFWVVFLVFFRFISFYRVILSLTYSKLGLTSFFCLLPSFS